MTTQRKKREPNIIVLMVAAVIAALVGGTMIGVDADDGSVIIGALLVLAAIIMFVIIMAMTFRAVKVVSSVTMGAAMKLNNMPLQPTPVPVADQIAKLAELHESGALSDAEFAAAKAQALAK